MVLWCYKDIRIYSAGWLDNQDWKALAYSYIRLCLVLDIGGISAPVCEIIQLHYWTEVCFSAEIVFPKAALELPRGFTLLKHIFAISHLPTQNVPSTQNTEHTVALCRAEKEQKYQTEWFSDIVLEITCTLHVKRFLIEDTGEDLVF